jgi:hypothetical protein
MPPCWHRPLPSVPLAVEHHPRTEIYPMLDTSTSCWINKMLKRHWKLTM